MGSKLNQGAKYILIVILICLLLAKRVPLALIGQFPHPRQSHLALLGRGFLLFWAVVL